MVYKGQLLSQSFLVKLVCKLSENMHIVLDVNIDRNKGLTKINYTTLTMYQQTDMLIHQNVMFIMG